MKQDVHPERGGRYMVTFEDEGTVRTLSQDSACALARKIERARLFAYLRLEEDNEQDWKAGERW